MDNIKHIVEMARSMRGASFAHLNYGVSPYCASFIRYLFRRTFGEKGELPTVALPPYYQRIGIRNPPGKWCADSLAGEEIGAVVSLQSMRAGDLVFYRDTYSGPFPKGSITHVAICVGAGGMIADARSGGVIFVGHYSAMSGAVVEVRRPRCLVTSGAVAPDVRGTKISLRNGKAQAILHGKHVQKLEINLNFERTLSVSVNHQQIYHRVADVAITPSQNVELLYHSGLEAGGIVGRAFQDHLKLNSHNGISRASYANTNVKQLKIKAVYNHYSLHIWINGRETRASSASITVA